MYKKYIKKLLTLFALSVIFLFIFVSIVIDPQNENAILTHKFNLYKIGSSYNSSTQLFNKLKTDKYILVFGTSRSHKLSEKILGQPTLNLSGSVYGEPNKVFNFLKQLNQKQKNNIIQVYYLLDIHTFSKNTSQLIDYNSYPDYIKSQFINFNMDKINLSLKTILTNYKGAKDYVDENGCKINLEEHTFNPKTSYGEINAFVKHQSNTAFDKGQFQYLSKIKKLLKNNNIKTTYFIPTFNILALKKFNFSVIDYQKKKFSEILDSYYDLSYIPYISNDYNKFSDFSHPKFEALKYIFTEINLEQYEVNKNNINEFLEHYQETLIAYKTN